MRGEAFVKFVDAFHYQRGAFEEGLRVAGYSIRDGHPLQPTPRDVLVLWNRSIRDEQLARHYEANGATVLVAENAYLGPEEKESHYFALARGHHNGAGTWYVGQNTRTHMIYAEQRPWRRSGEHIVILPQRGMGERGVKMELDWPASVEARLRQITKRPIIVRKHPGPRPHPPIMPELEDAWCAVTWASGSAIKAICAGIPVFYEFPQWIGAEAARFGIVNKEGLSQIESPYLGSPGTMLRKLSWAQWTPDEIRSGEAFKWLLSSS